MKESINGLQKPSGTPFLRYALKSPGSALATLALVLAVSAFTFRAAAEDGKSKTELTGTWKVTQFTTKAQANSPEVTLKLKSSGGTLTGTLSDLTVTKRKSRAKEWAITEPKLNGDELSFTVVRPLVSGQKDVTSVYKGKISGDSIKGTFTVEVLGQTFARNWEAARVADAAAITANGR